MGKIKMKMLLTFILLCFIIAFCSCGIGNNVADYRSRPFRCIIDFSVGERKICARLTVENQNNIRMEILSPDALAGAVVYGNGKAEYGGMTLDTDGFEEILSYGRALIPKGKMSKVNKVKGRDGLLCVTVKDEGEEGKAYEIYVDKKCGYPEELRFDGKTVFVRDFEFLD